MAAAPKTRRRLEYMSIAELLPADHNPKDHDEDAIAASIGRFGFAEPAVLDERTGKLVAGHGRLADLLRRMQADEAPPEGVVVEKGVWKMPVTRGWSSRSDAEAEAFLVALNRIGERGGWHGEELYAMLDRLSVDPDGLLGTGYDAADLDDLLAGMQEREVSFDPVEAYGTQGAHAEVSVAERAQEYARKGIRSLVLDYKLDEFDQIAADLSRLRRAQGFDTNAEVVFSLVAEAAKGVPEKAVRAKKATKK